MIAVNSNSMELESILLLKQPGLKNQLKFLLNFGPQLDAKAWKDRSGRVAMSKLKQNPKTDNLSWDLKKITWTERMPLNEWLTNSNSPALPLNYPLSFFSLPLTLLFPSLPQMCIMWTGQHFPGFKPSKETHFEFYLSPCYLNQAHQAEVQNWACVDGPRYTTYKCL